MSTFTPRFEVLSASQRELWPALSLIRDRFILYGGTALALRLGHRSSVDFDFFSFHPFELEALRHSVSWIGKAETLEAQPNTLTVLHRGPRGHVRVSFFGGLTFGTIAAPDFTTDDVLRVASLPDLLATKLNTIYQRAEAKDYLDVHALLRAGFSLAEGLGFAKRIYGEHFNTLLPLQALCYFEEPSLHNLPSEIKSDLLNAVQSVRSPAGSGERHISF
ncbi:MAG TPA: nucleotidyl transferase AbiEii/AbiGii toxin family protein [Verrucomicrobiota bacterium]|nr:nucleotidyl transferase AbiEii/AbiGii toxin family protein [Verrucomicrobiota bacterium]HNU50609.1 nucleotidyl transferase AbiEii/AbiGii toxin family protein [Verrucomicrobiota bacterium]